MYNGTISDLQHRVDDACLRFKAGAITSDLHFDYIEVDMFRNYADFTFDSNHLDLSARLDLSNAPKRFGRAEVVLLDGHIICYTNKVAGKFEDIGAQALLNYTYFKGEYRLKQWLDSIGEFYFKEYPIKGYHADFFLPKYNLVIEYNGSHDIDEKRCSFFMQEGYVVCNVKEVPNSWSDLLKYCYKGNLPKVAKVSKRVANTPKSVKQTKEKQYYLDPHFAEKVANKGDLLQCFTTHGKMVSYKEVPVHRNAYYLFKKESKKKITYQNGVSMNKEILKIFQLKSWPLIIILLKIAIHKTLSVGKCRKLYKQITKNSIMPSALFLKLSRQKALCVQLRGHILQILYDKPAGLILENGESWQPHATEQLLEKLAKARAAKKKNKG